MAAMGTNRNFLEIFFVSANGKKTVKQLWLKCVQGSIKDSYCDTCQWKLQ